MGEKTTEHSKQVTAFMRSGRQAGRRVAAKGLDPDVAWAIGDRKVAERGLTDWRRVAWRLGYFDGLWERPLQRDRRGRWW
jgi:hypothetical protein